MSLDLDVVVVVDWLSYVETLSALQILAAGGDYLFFVKGNQPTLEAAIALVFAEPPPGEPFATVTAPDRHGSR